MTTREIFSLPNFQKLWLAQAISDFGNSLTSLTLIILANQLTKSTTAVAIMALAIAIPQIVFGMLSGVYVDRWDRKRIMVISDALRSILVLAFIPAAASGKLEFMYVIAFLQASIGTFFNPARGAITPVVIPESGLLAANSALETGSTITKMLGLGAAGLLLGLVHNSAPVFLLDALTFLASALLVIGIRGKFTPDSLQENSTSEAFFPQLVEGLRIIFTSKVLVAVLVAIGLSSLAFGSTQVLYIPLLANVLHVPTVFLGIDEVTTTLGIVVSGMLMTFFAARLSPRNMVVFGLFLAGIQLGATAYVGNIWILIVLSFMGSLGVIPMQSSIRTLIQKATTNNVRGRVGSTYGTVATTAEMLSLVGAGLLGNAIGVSRVFLFAGTLALFSGIVAYFLLKPSSSNVRQALKSAETRL